MKKVVLLFVVVTLVGGLIGGTLAEVIGPSNDKHRHNNAASSPFLAAGDTMADDSASPMGYVEMAFKVNLLPGEFSEEQPGEIIDMGIAVKTNDLGKRWISGEKMEFVHHLLMFLDQQPRDVFDTTGGKYNLKFKIQKEIEKNVPNGVVVSGVYFTKFLVYPDAP